MKQTKSIDSNFLVEAATYIILAIAVVFTSFPILWGLATSLKPLDQINVFPPTLFPKPVVFESYIKVLFRSNFRVYLFNSIFMTSFTVLASTALASHAGYALARFKIPHRKNIMFALLMMGMVPIVALLIPLYLLSVQTGLYNTRLVILFIYVAWRTPIMTWILYGFFTQAPIEIEEAARIDGCTPMGTFYRIMLPISQPGLVSSALLSAVFVWNDFLIAFTFTTKEELRMVSVGLYNYITQYGIIWGELMAAAIVSIIPVIVLFILTQRKFVSGLAAGAVKG
jgi:ABC-type glycerol-3-phosphate transport system permease component